MELSASHFNSACEHQTTDTRSHEADSHDLRENQFTVSLDLFTNGIERFQMFISI